MRTAVSVNRKAKLLASDAIRRCCQASHQFSKTKSDMEGVIGCEVDLKESIGIVSKFVACEVCARDQNLESFLTCCSG